VRRRDRSANLFHDKHVCHAFAANSGLDPVKGGLGHESMSVSDIFHGSAATHAFAA
jgi:hypothetical protein